MRALFKIKIGAPDRSTTEEVEVWVDTAFNGSLVLPDTAVDSLMLPQQSTTDAILADGRRVELASFGCALDWFGKFYTTQVTTNSSKFGLLGTMLLDGRKHVIDYETKTVTID